jgi:hypothetical protein
MSEVVLLNYHEMTEFARVQQRVARALFPPVQAAASAQVQAVASVPVQAVRVTRFPGLPRVRDFAVGDQREIAAFMQRAEDAGNAPVTFEEAFDHLSRTSRPSYRVEDRYRYLLTAMYVEQHLHAAEVHVVPAVPVTRTDTDLVRVAVQAAEAAQAHLDEDDNDPEAAQSHLDEDDIDNDAEAAQAHLDEDDIDSDIETDSLASTVILEPETDEDVDSTDRSVE